MADGCLLCRFHHVQLHSNGWEIRRRDGAGGQAHIVGAFELVPPPGVDPDQAAIPLESKNPLVRQLAGNRAG